MPNSPTRLDRAAVERVLARATELQGTGVDIEGHLSEAQLEALAKEVGLDAVNLRQALAEERTRVDLPPQSGVLAALYGHTTANAQRVVRGTPSQVLRALDDWMQREETLVPQRHHPERIVWEAQRNVAGRVRRATSGKNFALVRATTVSATVVAIDDQRVMVRLEADLGGYRSMMLVQNAVMASAGVVGYAVLTIMSIPVLLAAAPVAVLAAGGYTIARGANGRSVARAQLSLEQVLDRLERGESSGPPSLIGMLAAVVGRKL